jgi:hypothetical protein
LHDQLGRRRHRHFATSRRLGNVKDQLVDEVWLLV